MSEGVVVAVCDFEQLNEALALADSDTDTDGILLPVRLADAVGVLILLGLQLIVIVLLLVVLAPMAVEPAGQVYPVGHAPEQLDEVRPIVEPYCPAGH